MTVSKKLAESKDGTCPHCASTFVFKTSGFGGALSAGTKDERKEITYKCYTCNKEFICSVEE